MLLQLTSPCSVFFFFNDTATTEIYTLSLHDALPISFRSCRRRCRWRRCSRRCPCRSARRGHLRLQRDRKSTRLNSSHANISYAVFCLKKKKNSTDEGFIARMTAAFASAIVCKLCPE